LAEEKILVALEQIEHRIDEGFQSVNRQFEKINQRIDQLDEALKEVRQRLGWLEKGQADDVVALLKEIRQAIEEQQDFGSAMNRRLLDVEARIERLQRKVANAGN